MNLTPRQQEVVIALRDFRHLHGYSPTLQELAGLLGISKVSVFEHVGALEKKRVLRRDKGMSRSIEIIADEGMEEIKLREENVRLREAIRTAAGRCKNFRSGANEGGASGVVLMLDAVLADLDVEPAVAATK